MLFFWANVLLAGLLLHTGAHGDEFSVALPDEMEVWRGSCLTMPCAFTVREQYRDDLRGRCAAMWQKADYQGTMAFTRATYGNLTQNNCTTTVHDVTEQQAGKVFFRLQCDNALKWTFAEKSLNIKVKEAPPAPTLAPPTLSVTEGESVSLHCSAPVPCPSVPPALTWSSVLGHIQETLQQQQDGTFVKVSTLTFTAAPSHHDRDISCSAAYNRGSDSVSQVSAALRPSVRYQPRNTAVSLRCSGDANPVAEQYRWYKADGGVQTLIGNSSIIDIKVSENVSHIFCEAQNELGVGRSVVTQLNEHFSARILRSSGCTGDSSQMSCVCEAEGNPSPQIHWRFSGISTNISITNEALNDTSMRSVVTVKEPQWRDPVALVCHSSNSRGSDTQTFTVPAFQRRGRPTNTRVTVSPSGPVAEHTVVTLTCSCEADPAVELYGWYKDDGGAHALIGNSAVLNINVSKDTTAFFCQSQNELGTDVSALTRLNVQYSPRNTIISGHSFAPVVEHDNVTLTCSSEANPAVQHYRWYKADGGALTLIGNSAVINFKASKDSSKIFCEALNDVGTDRSAVTQLLINYGPRNTRVTVQPQTSVREHNNVSLTCSSDASPAVQHYRWYKDDGGALTVIGNSAVLTMNASKDTTAVFCEAQNDLGTDNSTVTRLDVQYSPRNTTISRLSVGPVVVNADVTLTCSSDASPAARLYRWYKAEAETDTHIQDSAVLTMKASKDTTQIFCEALNDLGTDRSAVTHLDVRFSPRIQRSSNCTEDDERIRCSCEAEGNPVPVVEWHLPGISSNHSISSEPLSVGAVRSVITVGKPLSSDWFTLLCHSSNALGTRQQLLYTQAFQQERVGSEAGAGVVNNLLIAFVFILLVLVGVLLYVVRTLNVRLRKSQLLALTPESNELEEETEINIYNSANTPPAER